MGKRREINPLYRVFFPNFKKYDLNDPRLVNPKEIRGKNDSLLSLLDPQGNVVVSQWGEISMPNYTFETKFLFNIPGGNTIASCLIALPDGKPPVSLKIDPQSFTSDGSYILYIKCNWSESF